MTNRDHSLFRLDRRAVSEVVGYTLLIGITTVTVVALLVAATSLHGALQGSAETESVEQEMQDVDATFGRLAHGDNRSSVRVRTETSNHLSVVREGQVTVTVNDNCSVGRELSSIRHDKDGETYAQELGGTIRVTDGGQAMVSQPDLSFENGTVDLTITNITGRTASSMTFVKNADLSANQTNENDKILFAGTCSRPDNVTVSITSDFADAWERYLIEEFPTGTVAESGGTVNVTLTKSHLPEATDLRNNTVVDFSNSSHFKLDDVPSITIDKADDTNAYPVRVAPIYEGMQITKPVKERVDTTFVRKGIDVVLILDKSGSMVDYSSGYREDSPGNDEKIDEIQSAGQNFTGQMNESKDRAGVVWYDHKADIYPSPPHSSSNVYYLNNNSDAVNQTILLENSDFEYYNWLSPEGYYGGTYMNRGLYDMLSLYQLRSYSNRIQYAILLTDGNNDCISWVGPCSDDDDLNTETKELATRADQNGITIYSIGYGSDPQNGLLKTVAERTGGKNYTATTQSKLNEVFDDIWNDIVSSPKIVHTPASMSISAGSSTFKPSIPGSTNYIANTSNGFVNINDPTAPANFTVTFSANNGEPINLTSFKYGCEEWELSGGVVVNTSTNPNTTYYNTRCVDLNESEREVINGSTDGIQVYTNQNTTQDVINHLGESAWYQKPNLTTVLKKFEDGSGHFDLPSNTALVGVNYSNGQRMVFLLKVGRAQQTNDLSYVVDVTIDNVEIKEKDEQGS
jgi:hypothetical protein